LVKTHSGSWFFFHHQEKYETYSAASIISSHVGDTQKLNLMDQKDYIFLPDDGSRASSQKIVFFNQK
jgi:hypothetical protein